MFVMSTSLSLPSLGTLDLNFDTSFKIVPHFCWRPNFSLFLCLYQKMKILLQKMILRVFLFCFFVSTINCLIDISFNVHRNNVYVYEFKPRMFNQASDYCKSLNGSIVVINNAIEARIMTNMFIGYESVQKVWIRVHVKGANRTITDTFGRRNVNYTNWDNFEPSGGASGDRCEATCCVYMNEHSKWSDAPCNHWASTICQVGVDKTTTQRLGLMLPQKRTTRADMILTYLDIKDRISRNKDISEYEVKNVLASTIENMLRKFDLYIN